MLTLSFLNVAQPVNAAPQNGDLTVTIHYQRADKTYTNWAHWVWLSSGTGTIGGTGTTAGTGGTWVPVSLTSSDSYGAVATFTITGAVNVTSVGFVTNCASSWTTTCKDSATTGSGKDRIITLTGTTTEVWATDSSLILETVAPTPSPSPTTTSSSPAVTTPSPSPVSGNFTVTIHYANQGLVSTSNTYYSHVWLGDGTGGTISEGSDPLADKDGMDSYGGVLKLHITGAVDVTKLGIVQYSLAPNSTTWIKDGASAADRFIVLTGESTEVWMRSSAQDTNITYGPGSLTQPVGTGDPLSPSRPAVQTFKIHYNRSDGAYDTWKLYFGTQSKLMRPSGIKLPWIQSRFYDFATPITVEGPTGTESSTVGMDAFGAWVEFTLPYYAGHADWANMIIAKEDWSEKDGGKVADQGNRYITTSTSGTTEIWLLSGDTTSNGGNCAYAASPFGAPTISSLNPTSANRGATVRVSGTNLFPVTLAAPAITSTAIPMVTVGDANAVVTANDATSVTFVVPTEVTTGTNDVVVSTAGGPSSKLSLTVLHDPPTFEGVSPELIHRGDAVTVSGANFEAASSVKIGNTSVTIDPTSTDTELKFTVPTSVTPGTYTLTVTSRWGTSTKPDFVVVPDLPTISSISPKSGKVGDVITIVGTNLSTTTNVEFAGQEADLTNATITDTSVELVVPVTIPGTIKVTTTGGDVTSSETFDFKADAPVVTSVDPTGVHRGQLLTIFGTNLLGATVTIGGKETDSSLITNNTSDSVTVTVPSDVEIGPDAIIIVTTSGGSDATASVTILPDAPFIESLSVTEGGVGDTLTINGTALGGVIKVTFNGDGQSAAIDADLTAEGSSVTETAVTVIVPDGVSTGTITVTDSNEQTADSSETFMVYPKPEIFTMQNLDGLDVTIDSPMLRSDTVIITGINFGSAPTVKIGGVEAEVATEVSGETTVQFTVPNGAPVGATTVAVKGPGGSTTQDFFVKAGPPSIEALSANAGKAGDLLTISGLNLFVPEATTVTFIGVGQAAPVDADLSDPEVLLSDFSLTVRVPEGATTGAITITTSAGEVTSADLPDGAGIFTIVDPPTITSLSASSGIVGSSITITGTYLTDGTVMVGESVAEITDTPSDTSITFTVPADAQLGATTVSVTTAGGTVESEFTVLAPAPTITSLSATSAKAGVVVTATGTNLIGATVKVHGASAVITGAPTNTSVRFTVPNVVAGATTIVITTSGGSASRAFTVLPATPKITSFTQSRSPNVELARSLSLVKTSLVHRSRSVH